MQSEARNIRLKNNIWEAIENHEKTTGMRKAAIIEAAINSYLSNASEEKKLIEEGINRVHDDNLILQRMISATVVAQAISVVTSQNVPPEKFKEKVEEQASIYMRLAAGMERVLMDILAGKK